MNKAITNDLNKQMEDVKQKIVGLQNVGRLIANTLSLIGDMEVKGAYAKAVAEIQDWLTGFDSQVKGQVAALQSLLPKEAPKTVELSQAPADSTILSMAENTPETAPVEVTQ